MDKNFLLNSLGVNGCNYMNREYVLATKAIVLENEFPHYKIDEEINKIVKESDIFNLTFSITENGVFKIKEKVFKSINFEKVKIESDKIEELENEMLNNNSWLEPEGYLYKIVLIEGMKDKKIVIYFIVHHSIIDGIGIYNLLNRLYLKLIGKDLTKVNDTNEYRLTEKMIEINQGFWDGKKIKFSSLIRNKNLEELGVENIDFTPEEVSKIRMTEERVLNSSLMGLVRSYPIFYSDEYDKFAIDFAVNLRRKNKNKSLGMFVNILPMFFENIYECTIKESEEKIISELTSLVRYSSYQVSKVGETYANIMFSYIPIGKLLDENLLNQMDVKWLQTGRGPYNFAFTVFEAQDSISIRVDYKKTQYSSNEVKAYLEMMKQYIIEYVKYSEDEKKTRKFSDSKFVNIDYKSLNSNLNDDEECSFEKILDKSFKNNLSRNAIVTQDRTITFKHILINVLNNVDKIKIRIADKEPEVIFIYGNPSIESFVMMITAIYLGIPYMFLNSKVPKETILILNKEFTNLFFANEEIAIIEYQEFPKLLENESFEINLSRDIFIKNKSGILTYFCTSGTTGEPKVIPVKRKGVYNLISNPANEFIEKNDVSLLLSSLTFDLTVDPIYRTFLKGGTLVVIDIEKIFDEEYLLDCILKNKVDTVLGTPSALSGISDIVYEHLRKVGSVGEALTKPLANRLTSFDNLRIFNCYGPTEATCYCHLIEITGMVYSNDGRDVPIGKIIDNMKSYIVDPFGVVLPNGIKGELVLAGVGVLDNYYNYKGKDSVFCNIAGNNYYKTGDICYFENGNYYYKNRKGRQVKVNGYRIELSAVEEKMQSFFEKTFKVVIVNSMLVLFHEEDVEVEKIIGQAGKSLPNYMIPKKFFKVDKLPMNKNQKIDVKKLREMYEKYNSIKTSQELSSTEAFVYEIFAEVMGINNFSLDDDLYAIGGNSLMAIKISACLKNNCDFVEFDTVMKYQSVRKLARYIDSIDLTEKIYQFKGEFKVEYEPTEMQMAMILKQIRDSKDTTYIVGSLIKMDASDILIEKIESYIYSKRDFHFNARYEKGRFLMHYNEDFKIVHKQLELNDLNELKGKIKPFNILTDSLVRITDICINDKTKYVLFEMHHLISDGITILQMLHKVFTISEHTDKEVYFSEARDYMRYKYNQIHETEKENFVKILRNSLPSMLSEMKSKKDITVLEDIYICSKSYFLDMNISTFKYM
ncbi:AMP-binding protein [Clostridium sp.]|uniref:non-ribosomal peptide synthetase n=1 Tax=Clostridium sp. TaxID=1506 RepID=UPI003D6DA0AD